MFYPDGSESMDIIVCFGRIERVVFKSNNSVTSISIVKWTKSMVTFTLSIIHENYKHKVLIDVDTRAIRKCSGPQLWLPELKLLES